MPAFSLLRTLVGDNTKAVTREIVNNSVDGIQTIFQVDLFPLVSAVTANTTLFISGIAKLTAEATYSAAVGRITFTSAVTAGASIFANYKYNALSSGELTDILSGLTSSVYLAAANACKALAADTVRLGVYVQGNKSVNLDKVSNKLIDLSKDYENSHYRNRDDAAFDSKIFTFKDNSGTPYAGFDTAVAFLTTSGS